MSMRKWIDIVENAALNEEEWMWKRQNVKFEALDRHNNITVRNDAGTEIGKIKLFYEKSGTNFAFYVAVFTDVRGIHHENICKIVGKDRLTVLDDARDAVEKYFKPVSESLDSLFEEAASWKRDTIQDKIMTDDYWLMRAIVAIYKFQTRTEQDTESTREYNNVGFNGADAEFLTSIAKQILKRNLLDQNPNNRGYPLSDKQIAAARKCMKKYGGQLTRIANKKQVNRF